MEESAEWVADELSDLRIQHQGFDWPDGGTELFDLRHSETVMFYWARGQPTRGFVTEPSDTRSDGLYEAISMGYTTLATLEKVAVVADGEKLRVWPHSTRKANRDDLQPYQLVLPPGRGYLKLGVSWPFRYALNDAVELSARTAGPALLCRVLSHINWH